VINLYNIKEANGMKEIKAAILVISILVFLVISLGLWLAVKTNIPAFFVWTAISIGIIVFFGFIWIGLNSQKKFEYDTSNIRTTLTSSIIIVYLFIVCLTIFFREWSDKLDPLPQAMISNFTTIVGVVIAFYFTSSAYVDTRRKPKGTRANDQITIDSSISSEAKQ
jgi:hypothetical protein